ncbi:enoyl-CoA hydratase/isomerase family protein [Pseudaquabacterium rugosum]|uniref:Enoyl-CoA hydratase-related protein n=1 Tax=Pseudaquabacterium rugosum TaxID=2984194 RepID=A0ABU9BDA8_9BURK
MHAPAPASRPEPPAAAADDDGGPPTLTCAADGRCATLQLNRPRQHNRLSLQDLLQLQRLIDEAAALPGLRVLVLRAEGRSFSAGFHLGDLDAGDAEAATRGPRLFEQTVDRLEDLAVPTIARLQGGLYGGAIDLALACDFRVGLRDMPLRMPAARLGLHYYPSGLRRYVSRLGLQAAKRLFLLAPTLDGEALRQLGLLDTLADDEVGLDAAVDALVEALVAGAPLAVQGMKASLNEIARGEVDLARLRAREARCAASDDLREGTAAQAERRMPRFEGR